MTEAHIAVLRFVNEHPDGVQIDKTVAEWPLYLELWDAGCFFGDTHTDNIGQPDVLVIHRLTPEGRERLGAVRTGQDKIAGLVMGMSNTSDDAPFTRFQKLANKVLAVPKSEIDKREAKYQKTKPRKKRKPH